MPNKSPFFLKNARGFTIVELMISMVVLGILLAITLIAINPAENLARSRDTKRKADIEALANAIHQYVAKTGSLPQGLDEDESQISSGDLDLCVLIPTYLPALPQDPLSNNGARIRQANCTDYTTGYTAYTTTDGHFRVEAPSAEVEEAIFEIR